MIIPIFCPKCKDPLLTDFGFFNASKQCNKRLDHKLIMTFGEDDTCLKTLTIYIHKGIYARWNMINNSLVIYNNKLMPSMDAINELPYFEPNLLNYDALIKKLKVYIAFI